MKIKLLYLQFVARKTLFVIVVLLSITGMSLAQAQPMDTNILAFSERTNQLDLIISIKIKDVGILKLFKEIESSSDFKFVYDRSVASLETTFTLEEKDIRLYDLLKKISSQSDLRFNQINKNINVKRIQTAPQEKEKGPLADITVTGQVVDRAGLPVPGVTVTIPGSGIGAATDAEGKYNLSVPEESTLVFSFIGFVTKSVVVGNQTVINVILVEEMSSLEEVIVVGYGTQRKSDITGSVGVVSSKEFENEPILQVGQALQGKVAGLQVSQNSGAPGSGLLVRVRGTGTVNNAEPLYVVDGNPNANPLDLVPDQIESIQVLKSASAAAIYGAQGANGVILITTKQGKAGKSQLDINFSQGWQQIQRQLPMTNATQYATLYNEGLVNAGDAPLYPNPQALGEGTNWQNEVFQVAPMTDLSVSASGGSTSSKYFFSAGYVNQEGIVKGSSFDRVNIRINSSHDITPAIRVGQNLSASLSQYKQISEHNFGSVLGNTLTANPEVPVKMPDGGWGYSEQSLNSTNPLATIHYTNNDTRRPVINGNVFADITLAKDLIFRSQFNVNIGYSENTIFNPQYRISSRIFNEVANLEQTTSRFREHSWANTLTYQKVIGNHSFDLLAGITTQESYTEFISAYAAGLPENATDNPNLRFLNLSTQANRVQGDAGAWAILSYLGRLNYNYNNKYFSTVNFRVDGSSRFGVNNPYGSFPSFSLGWKISEEGFLRDLGWINNLMLRGGWGALGNQNSLPNYAFANLVTPNINYTFGNPQRVIRGQAPIGIGNPNLKWESTKETNVGFDFLGFDGKLSFAFDYYHKNTSDMLLRVPVPGYGGVQNPPFVNGGDVTNKGFEIMIGYEDTRPSGITYNISANLAQNRNEVTSLSNAGSAINQFISFVGLVNVTQVGSPIASFWGWQTDGIFQTQEEVDSHAFQSSGTAPGDFKFKDLNGDGVINAQDQTIIGNPWPKYTFGLNSAFSYKRFDLRVQLQGVYGNDIFMGLKFRTEGYNFFNYTQNVWENRWTGPGTSNSMPRANTDDPNNNMRSSEYYIEDGSYIRIRNIQLAYRFPSDFWKLRNISVFGSIQNALTFTKYPGLDPEMGTNRANNPLYIGIDETNYPVPRIYTLGFKIGI